MKNKRPFLAWNRENQAAFAGEISKELEKKASAESLENLSEITTVALTDKISKSGDAMTGGLEIKFPPSTPIGSIFPIVLKGKFAETNTEYIWKLGISTVSTQFYFRYNSQDIISIIASIGIVPLNKTLTLGYNNIQWANTFTKKINNGADIEIPAKAGTLALISDIEDILRQHGLI
jgi:hypothetical protein